MTNNYVYNVCCKFTAIVGLEDNTGAKINKNLEQSMSYFGCCF